VYQNLIWRLFCFRVPHHLTSQVFSPMKNGPPRSSGSNICRWPAPLLSSLHMQSTVLIRWTELPLIAFKGSCSLNNLSTRPHTFTLNKKLRWMKFELVFSSVIIHTHLKNTVLIQKSIALKVAHPPKHRSAKREGERDKVPVEWAQRTREGPRNSLSLSLYLCTPVF
jgi:hypothetical protein